MYVDMQHMRIYALLYSNEKIVIIDKIRVCDIQTIKILVNIDIWTV